MATERRKTGKKTESARRGLRQVPVADKENINGYDHLRDEINKIWTSWVENNSNVSDLWRRIEQSGLENAQKKLSTSKTELAVITGVSSDDADHICSVMVEFCELLNCIRLAYVDNESEIFDGDEREKKFLKVSCPAILDIWKSYSMFASDYASTFISKGWLNSSEHKDLLASVAEVAGSSAKLLVMAVNMDSYHNLDDTEDLLKDAIQATVDVCKETEDLLAKTNALGEKHTAVDKLTEILGWMFYGISHMSNKVIKVGIEARAPDNSFEDFDVLTTKIAELTKQMQEKWGEPPKEESSPPPQQVQEKKQSKDTVKIEEPTEDKKTKESYLDVISKYNEAYGKFSEEAWKDKRLPSMTGSGGVQVKYRTECYSQIGKLRVGACAMTQRKEHLDSLEITDDHILHSDVFVITPSALNCSQEVTIYVPLLKIKDTDINDIYLNLKSEGKWQEVKNPQIIQNDEQSFIVFNTMTCEAFTAMSYSSPDTILLTPKGANYVCPDNGKLEVIIPENCFTSDISLEIKVVQFDRNGNDNTLVGIVDASDIVHISSRTEGAEMKKPITVNLPIYEDVDDKDTELVVARCNATEVQVLDKKQIAIKAGDRNDVYSVDMKGFWSVAILRIKRIFLNMRESIKREFYIGFGIKQPCYILTFIDDLSRGDEMQTFAMEVVEKDKADIVADEKLQAKLFEIKKGRSKEILLKRGDQILMHVDGQMRCSEASSEEEQTLCYLNGCTNVISISTEIKRDPEKMPDAMLFYKQKPNDTTLHSIAIVTRELSELPTDQIAARTGMHTVFTDTKKGKQIDESAIQILKMESLMSLARELTFDDASKLGEQLGVKPEVIKQIKESNEKDPVVGNFQILCQWRGPRARAAMADFLVSSLKAVGKMNYADLVTEVRKHNRGLERTDFHKPKDHRKIAA
ncbi:uncharacterized protein LOC132760564 isoform X2 [Ruditapes philippinarum]|uniref:uncharacterized protein LOC132760564 isoform X2 n=1 Tax=Ruditapes philippinarum TaxID=129788 RepID=UPI00295BE0B5|nr:uncharacterized protein LOC132760564 isoform X2 [Ruditapes philippinarum]